MTSEPVIIPIAQLIRDGIDWTEQPVDEQHNAARGFIGIAKNWRFVVASFSIERQGFPQGSRGYDGTAMADGAIIRLPRPQAQMLVEDAISKLDNSE